MRRSCVSFLRFRLALAVMVPISASFLVYAQRPLAGISGVSAQRPLASASDLPVQGPLANSPDVSAQKARVGIPEDWSFHRVVFSNPGNREDAAGAGKVANWNKVVNDERFQIQQRKNALRERRYFGRSAEKRQNLTKDWSMNMGLGATVGAGQYPAKFTFDTTAASCSDFVVYNTSLAGGGSGGQANIVAYSNLYEYSSSDMSGCQGTVPSVSWAYSTGSGEVLTSPVLSDDGSKVAFVENTSSGAILQILQWASGEGTPQSAAIPDYIYANSTVGSMGNTSWNATNCPSGESCLISVPFQNGDEDTISAPFYVYSSADTIYVGDAKGNLHEFTGVFDGTPAEATTGGWPIAVSGNVLTSPVYDSGASGNVFVADSGGYLYSFNGITAAPQMQSSQLTANGNTTGIVDAPMLDPSTEEVYVFVGDDANTTGAPPCYSSTGCDGVFQFSAANQATGTGTCNANGEYSWSGSNANCGEEAVLGLVGTTAIYDGTFDHIYQVGMGTSGYLWVCDPVTSSAPGLMYVGIQSDGGIVPSGQVAGLGSADLSSLGGSATCSSVTENWGSDGTSNDYIFLSVTASGNQSACAGACLYNFVVGTGGTATEPGTFLAPSSPTGGFSTPGGSSGIVIDNNLSNAGNTESQIYYTPLANQSCGGNGTTGSDGTGGCAVQTSQIAP